MITDTSIVATEIVIVAAAFRASVFLVAGLLAFKYSWRISVLLLVLFANSILRAVGFEELNSVLAVPVAVGVSIGLVTLAGHERVQRRLQ